MARDWTDDDARRFGAIFGDGLAAQIINQEYLVERGRAGGDGLDSLLMMRRAMDLRALDATQDDDGSDR